MKNCKILAILILSSVIFFYNCNDGPTSKVRENLDSSEVTNTSNSSDASANNETTPTISQNASGVYHYTCSNGCAGGADSAVNCSTCGTLLTHNQAFHATNTNNTPSTPAPFATAPTAASGQNAAGQWHYNCPSGCAGGSGSAGSCSTCGTALAHNSAYH